MFFLFARSRRGDRTSVGGKETIRSAPRSAVSEARMYSRSRDLSTHGGGNTSFASFSNASFASDRRRGKGCSRCGEGPWCCSCREPFLTYVTMRSDCAPRPPTSRRLRSFVDQGDLVRSLCGGGCWSAVRRSGEGDAGSATSTGRSARSLEFCSELSRVFLKRREGDRECLGDGRRPETGGEPRRQRSLPSSEISFTIMILVLGK